MKTPGNFAAALLGLAFTAAVFAGDPQIIYTKSFPGSDPAYVEITIDPSGQVAYREAPDDDPETFQLDIPSTAQIFDLAEKLDHFSHPLESGLKVANMGAKTLRWQNGGKVTEAKFNYTLDPNAKALQDWFERISETERLLEAFRRAVKHDKLGVDNALLNIWSAWDHKRLAGAEQFLPLLDQVAKSDLFMHMDRERAAELAEQIRAAHPKA
ncbi:MAG TPA: hypothetical protein VKX39_09105 [Bryobacteraceae bacterium]|jgi:hypothetical protein|nr:hypothetical protein [Bryobacteraceae bacterium]